MMKNKILIIDDSRDFVASTKALLEENGYDVITAYNGDIGFQKAKQESPDLILLNMAMTYLTEGAEIAKSISQDAAVKKIPIIMVTAARSDANFPFDFTNTILPVKTILDKPVKPEELLTQVKTCIMQTGAEHRRLVASLDKLIEKWKGKQGNLIMILHEIQNNYGYVPRDISFELSRMLDVPLARIYEVITFYNYFKLEAPGKHTISVCLGTACYLKGAPTILEELKNRLDVEEGKTTKDGLFHLQVVRCLGCCGLAPVVMIDDKIYGKVKKSEVTGILSKYVKD